MKLKSKNLQHRKHSKTDKVFQLQGLIVKSTEQPLNCTEMFSVHQVHKVRRILWAPYR